MEPEEGDVSIVPSGLDMTLALFPPEKDKALKKPDPPPGKTKPDMGKKKIMGLANKTKRNKHVAWVSVVNNRDAWI